MLLFPLLKDAPMLFHSLCDLISYELFLWNDLLTACLNEVSCSSASVFCEDTFLLYFVPCPETIGNNKPDMFSD